jgi:hypothetical protein
MLASRPSDARRRTMTLCPIALAVGCKKCPAFSICPLKSVIGDYDPSTASKQTAPKSKPGAKKSK